MSIARAAPLHPEPGNAFSAQIQSSNCSRDFRQCQVCRCPPCGNFMGKRTPCQHRVRNSKEKDPDIRYVLRLPDKWLMMPLMKSSSVTCHLSVEASGVDLLSSASVCECSAPVLRSRKVSERSCRVPFRHCVWSCVCSSNLHGRCVTHHSSSVC